MILASIKPYYYYLIAEEKKKIEVRKTALKNLPQDIVFYMSKDEKSFAQIPKEFQEKYRKHFGKVGIEFICDKVYKIEPIFSFYDSYSGYDDSSDSSYFEDYSIDSERLKKTCLTRQELYIYGKEKTLYGWNISNLRIYGKPKELSEFGRKCDYASEIHCRDCLILGDWDSCCSVMCKPITRPPQSYMEVKEL